MTAWQVSEKKLRYAGLKIFSPRSFPLRRPSTLAPRPAQIHRPRRIWDPDALRTQPPQYPLLQFIAYGELVDELRHVEVGAQPYARLPESGVECHRRRRILQHSGNLPRRLLEHLRQHLL